MSESNNTESGKLTIRRGVVPSQESDLAIKYYYHCGLCDQYVTFLSKEGMKATSIRHKQLHENGK